jgi:hypothetical protein
MLTRGGTIPIRGPDRPSGGILGLARAPRFKAGPAAGSGAD